MASSAELIIAKTSLSGALFRADPRSCSRDEIESMLALLNSATTQCSPSNVQKCKQWALSNLVPSSTRIAPFCKYLVALVRSFGADATTARRASPLPDSDGGAKEPSAKRKRLHVLYILNDILYHVKFRDHDDSFAAKLEAALPSLVRSASSFINCPKHITKIQDLVALWEENRYFSGDFINQLRAILDESPLPGKTDEDAAREKNAANAVSKASKAAPFIMPAMHGDPSMPWYDLPAGNWLSALEPNSTRPLNPAMIKPLVLQSGPADKTLVEAVKSLLVDVERIYSKDVDTGGPPADIGQMGELLEPDEMNGDELGGDTYYGWSRAFCKKMKARRQGGAVGDREQTRGRTRSSRSYSRSPSPGRSPRRSRSDLSSPGSGQPSFKRPRLSNSPPGRRHNRSRTWTRSPSRSRSKGSDYRQGHKHQASQSRSRSKLRSRSRSRSQSASRGFQPKSPSHDRPGSRTRSRSRSRSPHGFTPAVGHIGLPPHLLNNGFMPPHPPPNYHQPPLSFPIPPIPPQGNGVNFPLPPPPQSFPGQWPPPPPPVMIGPPIYYGGNVAPPPFAGGWAPPLPPLHPHQQQHPHPYQQQQQHYPYQQQPQHPYPHLSPPPPPPALEHHNAFQPGRGNGNFRGMSGGRGGGYNRGGGNRW